MTIGGFFFVLFLAVGIYGMLFMKREDSAFCQKEDRELEDLFNEEDDEGFNGRSTK